MVRFYRFCARELPVRTRPTSCRPALAGAVMPESAPMQPFPPITRNPGSRRSLDLHARTSALFNASRSSNTGTRDVAVTHTAFLT